MSDPRDLLQELQAQMRREFPGFRVRFKDESALQKGVGQVLAAVGHERYLSSFVTVFGRTVWWPSEAHFRQDPLRTVNTLLHERVHLWDARRDPVWFHASYVAAGPAIYTMRAHWEQRAYAVDLRLKKAQGVPEEWLINWMIKLHGNVEYGYMCPFPEKVTAWCRRVWDEGWIHQYPGDEELYASTEVWMDRVLQG